MTNTWLELKTKIAESIGTDVDKLEEPDTTKNQNMGDIAFPCFNLSKTLKKDPKEIAKSMVDLVQVDDVKVNAIGPYINFYINWEKFSPKLIKTILKEKNKFGKGKEKKRIMMDVYSANPFKVFHIGHIRNAILGESIRRLLEFQGNKTTTYSYSGDVGIHVARWLLYYTKYYKGKLPKENFTKWVSEIYAKASKMGKDSEEFERESNRLNRKLDQRDKKLIKIWKKIRDLCYDDYKKIAEELDIKVEHYFPESVCEEPGKKLVYDLLGKAKLTESEGAIGLNLEKFGLGFFILLKSDRTALYATKDYGLFQLKNKISNYDKCIYIVGSEQDYYQKQLHKSFELLGLSKPNVHHHVSYALVTLKEGKMSSRLGNIIPYEDARDYATKKIKEEIEKRNPKLKNKEKIAQEVAFAAIKFSMLNVENNKGIKFDWNETLDFEGKSGPYIEYSYVRASSLLKKSKKKSKPGPLINKPEILLLKNLAIFPEIAKEAAIHYSPHILSNYIYNLAKTFNKFYETNKIIGSRREENLLSLVESYKIIIKQGLKLLGIETTKKM